MAATFSTDCAICTAPVPSTYNGTTGMLDNTKAISTTTLNSVFCSAACLEKSRGAPILIATWID